MKRTLKPNSTFARLQNGPALILSVLLAALVLSAGPATPGFAKQAAAPPEALVGQRLHPALPPGLPQLPAIGERMSTDDLSGLALRGFDPVAYFVNGQPTAGLAEFEYSWSNTVWRFRSEANRAAFMAEPQVYAPLFDGYDAVAVADDRIVESDPRTFAIINGRLCFFRTETRRDAFRTDTAMLDRSLAAWPHTMRQLSR